MNRSIIQTAVLPLVIAVNQALSAGNSASTGTAPSGSDGFQYRETRELAQLVTAAAELLRVKGQDAFADFRGSGSRWQQGERYIFVLDDRGTMLVHPDATMEGKNQLDLKDINGRPIIRGLIGAVTTAPDKTDGWYQYQWPSPGQKAVKNDPPLPDKTVAADVSRLTLSSVGFNGTSISPSLSAPTWSATG